MRLLDHEKPCGLIPYYQPDLLNLQQIRCAISLRTRTPARPVLSSVEMVKEDRYNDVNTEVASFYLLSSTNFCNRQAA